MARAEQDTIKLLNIFPQEVWQLVLDKVTDCTTFQHLRHSSPFFNPLTDSQRSQVLFSAVVDKLCSYFPKSERNINTTLKCRLVCRAWHYGVDSFLENMEPHLKLSPNHQHEKCPKHIYYARLSNNFDSAMLVIKHPHDFYRHFSASHSFSNGDPNPFVGRIISIELFDAGDPRFAGYLIPVLKRWGHHIWFAYFRIGQEPYRYELFSRFMEYLPNLKVVNVKVFNDNRATSDITVSDNIPVFQHYPQLQCIKTFDLPEFVWDKLRERNSHVAQVDVVSPEQCRILRLEEARERETARIRWITDKPYLQLTEEQIEGEKAARQRKAERELTNQLQNNRF